MMYVYRNDLRPRLVSGYDNNVQNIMYNFGNRHRDLISMGGYDSNTIL